MDVDEQAGLASSYELKLNSYDLAVDIELYDCVQRLRFEHPEVGAVVISSAKERLFCAGANIRMLAGSDHNHKVNFCKFTNETRLSIEDASEHSGQRYLCAVNGSCAGGGYELALACDHIVMADDRNTAVSLPEVPLLAVLPGTGGLTRLTDKRKVRRDRADFFCTLVEGIKGQRAVDWGLVDEIVPLSQLEETAAKRASDLAAKSDRPGDARGVALTPLNRRISEDALRYETLSVELDRDRGTATFTLRAPEGGVPADLDGLVEQGVDFWALKLARELDDAILHLRLNEVELGTWVIGTQGDASRVAEVDALLDGSRDHWLVREITLYLKRALKRLDVSARSIFTLIAPGSCFTGTLLELALASDRIFMLDGQLEDDDRPPATIRLTPMNFGPYPMVNGLTRLESRFLGEPGRVDELKADISKELDARSADERGLVTFTPDDTDWEDEVRIAIEERAAFSPDSLSGMEASLRFGGPETMEAKIFGRLSAWQNWIFQRPNAVGEKGALRVFGSGERARFDKTRV
jgi:benzoyl-CoA-dihydrodiol lyase